MRKFIACLLLLAMVCSLFGCGKKGSETTASTPTSSTQAPVCSVEDFLMHQATNLAQRLGVTANLSYLEYIGIRGPAAQQARVFSNVATLSTISCGAFLPTKDIDLPGIISEVNTQVNTADQLTCSNLLTFSTNFFCPMELAESTAVWLYYSSQCHMIVFFDPQENNIVEATVYPLFPDAGRQLISQYFSNLQTLNKESIQNSRHQALLVSCTATPTKAKIGTPYYVGLAKTILADATAVSVETLQQHTSDSALITQAQMFANMLTSNIDSSAVFRFPGSIDSALPNLSSPQAEKLAKQHLYLSWTNSISATFSEHCVAANTIVNKVINTRNLGAVAVANEAPVLIALSYGSCTALVTIYPNEYNTYLYSITCLPCNITEATSILAHMGAEKI